MQVFCILSCKRLALPKMKFLIEILKNKIKKYPSNWIDFYQKVQSLFNRLVTISFSFDKYSQIIVSIALYRFFFNVEPSSWVSYIIKIHGFRCLYMRRQCELPDYATVVSGLSSFCDSVLHIVAFRRFQMDA